MPRRSTKKPVRYYSAKRRKVYALGDEINHLTLFELFAWTCVICNGQINRHVRLPNWEAATVEHITPLSQGGTHTWDNVGPAHARCNFQKGSSLTSEFSGILAV